MLQKLCSMMLGTLLLMAASPWQQLAGQEKQPNGSQTRVFQSVIGDKSTLKSLFELARPIPRRAEFVNHFIALELAARSYKEPLKAGSFVFGSSALRNDFDRLDALRQKGVTLKLSGQLRQALFKALAWQPVYHWQVLEVAERSNVRAACSQTRRELRAEDWQGFQAVTYVNHRSKDVVVAIAGTDPGSKDDLFNDLVALRGKQAPHFEVACAYFQHLRRTYASQLAGYSYSCSGHSLGGGACSVAATRLGLRGVTLNPIGTQRTVRGPVLAQPSMIANYIDPKDFALSLYKTFDLNPNGRIYWISDKPMSQGLLESFYQFIRRQPKIVRMWDSYLAHSATRSLDRLSKFQRIGRFKR